MLIVASIFKKSWSLCTKAWLAFGLLEQILRNNYGEVLSNRTIIFVRNPTMTQPEEIRGKHGQEPQHNLKGNCTTFEEWSLFLFCQKITISVWSCFFFFLFHANNTFIITFKHETIVPRIFGRVSLFFQSYAWSYMFTRIFGNSKLSTKQKSYWCLFKQTSSGNSDDFLER
jgi:hypothetical protein